MTSTNINPDQYDSAGGPQDFPQRGFGPHGHRGHGGHHGGHHGGPLGARMRRRHGGFGPGPFNGQPFGPEGFGPRGGGRGFGPGGPRGRRARKGDVRSAILSLLAQSPANGYALIQAIADHSDGSWKPSPGSVYPTLAQLVDEGLIAPVDSAAPRSDYQLTEAGRAYVGEHGEELAATWNSLTNDGPLDATGELIVASRKLAGVLRQFAHEATPDQQRAATSKLNELRRELYRTLGE